LRGINGEIARYFEPCSQYVQLLGFWPNKLTEKRRSAGGVDVAATRSANQLIKCVAMLRLPHVAMACLPKAGVNASTDHL
jgi:hypothetical protein